VINGHLTADALPSQKLFDSREHSIKWHHIEFKDDIGKIIMIGDALGGKAGIWYGTRPEYMINY
jgi:hypothetical protein